MPGEAESGWRHGHALSGRRLLVALAIAGLSGFVLWRIVDPTSVAVAAAVRAAILTDMTIAEPPLGSSPGRVSQAGVAELEDRLDRVLPTVYTGDLLTLKLDRLTEYVTALSSNDALSVNVDAGISSLVVLGWPSFGSHADVSGSVVVWVAGQHWENGSLVDDRSEGAWSFTAGLDKVGGRWLVSTWSSQQTR